ncbi:lactonase family protein [Chitinophaga lutea]
MEKSPFLLIGTYTNGKSQGIYLYRLNPATGEYKPAGVATGVKNPSFLTASANKQLVYAVNESAPGGANAFRFDASKGTLTRIGEERETGNGPCYINTDPQGHFAFTGNYSGGSITVLPIQPDGSLATMAQDIVLSGSGPDKARQAAPHVHSINFSPDGRQVFVPDLGTDRIMVYDFRPDHRFSPLQPAATPSVSIEPGGGPRHMAFHPNGRIAYVVHEMTGKITAFSYTNGTLKALQTISSAPAGYKGSNFGSADIHCSPDGKFLYMSNRGDLNHIAVFAVDKDGKLSLKGHQSTLGKGPRNFIIDPSGATLLVANQQSGNVVVFRRDAKTGMLSPTGQELQVPDPVCLLQL